MFSLGIPLIHTVRLCCSVSPATANKPKVIGLYKNLLYLSRDWPTDLRPQIKNAFLKNKHVNTQEEIDQLVARGEYVCREIIAAYHIRKYRTMKKRYYNTEENPHLQSIFKSFQ